MSLRPGQAKGPWVGKEVGGEQVSTSGIIVGFNFNPATVNLPDVYDSSINEIIAEAVGPPTYNPEGGLANSGHFCFDGSSDWGIFYPTPIGAGVNDVKSIVLWVKRQGFLPSQEMLLSTTQDWNGINNLTGSKGFKISIDNNKVSYLIVAGVVVEAPTQITDLTDWHLVVVTTTVNNGQIKIYIDGQLSITGAGAAGSKELDGGYTGLGISHITTNFLDRLNACMDGVRIYDRVLTPEEILLLYENRQEIHDAYQHRVAVEVSKEACIASYNFNSENIDTIGSRIYDASINRFHLPFGVNPPTHFPIGGFNFGGVYDFDGINDNFQRAVSLPYNVSKSFTMLAWIRSDSITGLRHVISAKVTGLASPVFALYTNGLNAAASIEVVGGGAIVTAGNITINSWHLLCATYNITTGLLSLYIDRELVGTFTATAIGNLKTAENFAIGFNISNNTSYFDGLIDEVRIYNRELLPEEVKALYNTRDEFRDSIDPLVPPIVSGSFQYEVIPVTVGAQTIFPLAFTPINPTKVEMVHLNGIEQENGVDFTVAGNIVTYIPPPVLNPPQKVLFKYFK